MKVFIYYAFLYLYLIHVKRTNGETCLRSSSNIPSICECCSNGYTGFNCTKICPNCISRIFEDGSCKESCKGGFYGSLCDMQCSTNCIGGIGGRKICRKHDGSCVNGCVRGHYGQHCNLFCSHRCRNLVCAPKDGRCNGCEDNSYYGNNCNIPCRTGCFNGTCTRNGKCIGGCNAIYYGNNCEYVCDIRCKYRRCTYNEFTGYHCTDGCEEGYTSITCSEKCSVHCKECNQKSGSCISCTANTEKHCENGDCLSGHVSCTAKTLQSPENDLHYKWILLILGLILLILAMTPIVLCYLWRRGILRCLGSRNGSDEMPMTDVETGPRTLLLSDTGEAELTHDRKKTSRTIPGTLGDDITQRKIYEAGKLFVSTKIYKHVKDKLKEHGHVTILGASGEGKTTMSLILAREYMEKEYKVVFVDRIGDLDLEECITSTPMLLIFDDIFGSVGLSTDIMQLRNRLDSLLTYLRTCKDAVKTNTFQPSQNNQLQTPDIRIVFNSKPYNFQRDTYLLQYEFFYFFNEQTVVNLTTSKDKYSKQEKIDIFNKYRQNFGETPQISAEDISSISDTLFGFPLTCRLFFDNQAFREKGIQFFHEPLSYLKTEIQTILKQKNNQAAALALMLLCENKVNLPVAERPGQFQAMDDRFKLLLDIFPKADRGGICTAARDFIGTFFSGKDVLEFAHPSIYDACASAMYDFNKSFVLQYCSYDFLFERIKSEPVTDAECHEQSNYIIVSESYSDIVALRLYEAMKEGNFTKSLTHLVLAQKPVENLVLEKLKSESNQANPEAADWIHRKDEEKGFLYWATLGHSRRLVVEIENVLKVKFAQIEIREALDAAVHKQKDNQQLLEYLLSRIDKDHLTITTQLLLLSAKHGGPETARYLLEKGADVNTTDDKNQSCVHLACYFGNANVLKILLENHSTAKLLTSGDNEGRTPAMLAALLGSEDCFQLVCDERNSDVKDKYGNRAIHLACYGGNRNIVERLFSPSNIDSTGKYNWTPVMYSVFYGHPSVFDFLKSKGANLELLDEYGSSLLHLACQGGSTAIVKKLVSDSNINIKGMQGWTPVMFAVQKGHESVFNFLLSHNADLTVVSEDSDTLLHLACQGGSKAIVQQLLPRFNIDRRGRQAMTPAMKAAYHGHKGVLQLLIDNHANLELLDIEEKHIVAIAKEGVQREVVEFLEIALKK